ncbi:putative porin [Serratia bockelmannii]|uniref:putative porin n=1 Tax=Serratia bockelmannii TaxID=2703793 RepID=UPI00247A9453|nr:putative porin [Serratia bockelmannii]MDH7588955.1 putative porin [Serratia bockelmannii]
MNFQLNGVATWVAVSLALSAGPALAAPSENATVNLIRLLVKQGVLTKEQSEALVRQAEEEAQQARQQPPRTAVAAAAGPDVQPGDVRVPYIPETVRDQIRDEVKGEVIAQAKSENWAAPNTFPAWASRIKVTGDVRTRSESRFYSGGNSDQVIDFNALNDGGPYDVNTNTNTSLPPLLNTRKNRENRFRVRARLGVEAALSDNWSSAVRVATGSDDSPVSTNQTLGDNSGKKNIWLDRAWIGWHSSDNVWDARLGRAANPFVSTDILFSNELNLDGIALSAAHLKVADDTSLFGTLGAFPLEYGSDSWPSRSQNKGKSEDKWLFGAQVGSEWRINENNTLRGALAYYHFENIEGRRSSSCSLYTGDPACDTDWSRPGFMQKGNTLFLLRNIALDPNNPQQTPQPQYVGLASEFNLLDVNLIWDTETFNALKLRLQGDYVRNLAYDESKMRRRSEGQIINNLNGDGGVQSGANAWMVQAALGRSMDMSHEGDWNLYAGYKYIQPDALPDAYNDSSFHLGGTNAKGYYLGANYALTDNVSVEGRWSSSDEVYGDPLSINVFQLDLNARF